MGEWMKERKKELNRMNELTKELDAYFRKRGRN